MVRYNRLLFIGSKSLGSIILKKLIDLDKDLLVGIATLDDRSDSRTCFDEFTNLSQIYNIPIEIVGKKEDLEVIVRNYKPDICIVANFYHIIEKNLLSKVPGGFIGFHFSLLPKYRGFAPIVWSVINGDKESGLSMFYFDSGIDSGDIITQKTFKIEKHENISDLMDKATALAVEALDQNYDSIINGRANRRVQNHNEATHTIKRTPKDGLINWNQSSSKIFNFIRAQTVPYPCAFTYNKGLKIHILESTYSEKKTSEQSGTVVHKKHDIVRIACDDGIIEINRISIDGNKNLRSGNFFSVGDILDMKDVRE